MDHCSHVKDMYWTVETTVPKQEIVLNRTVCTTILLTEITIYRKYEPPFSQQRKLQNRTVLATSFLEGDSYSEDSMDYRENYIQESMKHSYRYRDSYIQEV